MADLPQMIIQRSRRRRTRASTKYLRVRRRPSGRYAAEIRNPYTKECRWLGTFDTAEDAAVAYDLSSISFSGLGWARTNFVYPNFLSPPPPPPCSPPPPPPPSSSVEEREEDEGFVEINGCLDDDDDCGDLAKFSLAECSFFF